MSTDNHIFLKNGSRIFCEYRLDMRWPTVPIIGIDLLDGQSAALRVARDWIPEAHLS
jgi:hypothetical protein